MTKLLMKFICHNKTCRMIGYALLSNNINYIFCSCKCNAMQPLLDICYFCSTDSNIMFKTVIPVCTVFVNKRCITGSFKCFNWL